MNNNFITSSTSFVDDTNSYHYLENSKNNHIVLRQNEALLNDDPLLSSTSVIRMPKSTECQSNLSEYQYNNDCDEDNSSTNLQCKWETCYQIYDSQNSLVKHIEKTHVELKRGKLTHIICSLHKLLIDEIVFTSLLVRLMILNKN